MRVHYLLHLIIGTSLFACSESHLSDGTSVKEYKKEISSDKAKTDSHITLLKSTDVQQNTELINGVEYHIHYVSAWDYLERKRVVIDEADFDKLDDESVFMVEFSLEKSYSDILKSEKMELNPDEAIQYLIGDISNDFSVYQEGTLFKPNGVNYEGKTGPENRLRVAFYMKGIDLTKNFTVKYYDHLFGNGMIRFKNESNNILS